MQETYQDLESPSPHVTIMYDEDNQALFIEATRPDTQITIDKSVNKCPFKSKVKILRFMETGEI